MCLNPPHLLSAKPGGPGTLAVTSVDLSDALAGHAVSEAAARSPLPQLAALTALTTLIPQRSETGLDEIARLTSLQVGAIRCLSYRTYAMPPARLQASCCRAGQGHPPFENGSIRWPFCHAEAFVEGVQSGDGRWLFFCPATTRLSADIARELNAFA